MSDKEVVIDVLKRLPEGATLDEISEELAILAAIRRGEVAAEQGKVISHAELKERSAQWTSLK
jgi:predicted transcriptional regulator